MQDLTYSILSGSTLVFLRYRLISEFLLRFLSKLYCIESTGFRLIIGVPFAKG